MAIKDICFTVYLRMLKYNCSIHRDLTTNKHKRYLWFKDNNESEIVCWSFVDSHMGQFLDKYGINIK